MPSSSLHITLYNWLKPFLELAKSKGFAVSPDTHIQILAVLSQCADKIENESIFYDYFSPLIAKNKEDHQLLKNEWEKWCGREKLLVNQKPPPVKPKWRYRWLMVAVTITALLLAAWFFYLFFSVHTATVDYKISYTDVTHPVQFDAMKSVSDSADTARIKFVWNFGDGGTDTSGKAVVLHSYRKAQLYSTSLTLLPLDSHISIVHGQLKTPFTLCKPALYISQQPDENITTGQEVTFSVNYNSLYPTSNKTQWQINGETVAAGTPSFTTRFDSAATYAITYTDAAYVAGTSCDSVATLSLTVKLLSALGFTVNQTASAITPPVVVNWHNIIALAIVILYLTAQYTSNRKKLAGKDREATSRSSDVVAKLTGTRPPYEIPFKNKDDIINDEPLLPALAKNFKRRIADENLYLNIPLTISSTVQSEGFLLPVFSQKTKPSEYLILIDKNNVKSAQVKLFEYLIKRFAKSDIYTDVFYFYDKPDYGFNAYYPRGIYISRLYDLYPDHTVIIFGNGYSFLEKYYPALSEATTLPYTKWTNHVIFTPVPYNDWGGKEALLQKSFLLLPADMEGQLLLFNFIDKPESFTGEGLQSLQPLYKTKGFNANKAEKLKQYLNDEFLFQWLCALAISPSIYWQTMLGIGDALQKERYYNEVIHYSSILKLVRISWMRDAAFPEEVRLDLLKHLEPQNEQIARQAMIRMMDEAALRMNENSFAFEELHLQQLTDKFLLYTSNPDNGEFKNYKTAHDEFKALWKDGKITDTVLKEYLKKEEGGEWSTLIGNSGLSNNPQSSVSINSLFDDSTLAARAKWLKIANATILLLISVVALFAASIFLFKNNWSHTLINDKLKLVSADTGAMVPFTFGVVYNSCFNSVQRQSDATILTLDFGNNNLLSLAASDTIKQKQIPYSWLNNRQVALHISSHNMAYNFDSSFVLSSARLSLSINGCAVYCNQWITGKSIRLEPKYNGDWYDNSIVSGINTAYSPVHIEPNAINGEPIAEISNCMNDSQLLRVITLTDFGDVSLYYLSQTQAGSINFDQHSNTYHSLAAAGKDTSTLNLSVRIPLVSNSASFTSNKNFFATFNGKWRTDDSADIMDISASQNTILLDNKYPFTVSSEQQAQTTWGKPLYKLSILQNGKAPSQKPFLYLLLLDSATALISSEEQDTGAVHYSIANMGTFQRMHKQSTAIVPAETPASLPSSLNEIWHGGTSNRLINLFLPKNVIYYSVNDTKTYGTYNIFKVSLLSDGTYKIITKTGEGYKLFFIKDITAASFNLSVCEDFLQTLEEAAGKIAANCDHFNTMSLYYENDPSLIYLPVSFSNNLVASQKAKLDKVVAAINGKTATISGINVELSYTPPNLSSTVAAINAFLQKNGIPNKITSNDINSSVINHPFTRSAIAIKTISVANASQQEQTNNSNTVKEEKSTETTLGTITWDEKSQLPDTKSLQLIEAVANQLKHDTASRLIIDGQYALKEDKNAIESDFVTITQLFIKQGVATDDANNPLQIEMQTGVIMKPPVRLQKQPTQTAPAQHYINILLTGINFPSGFSAGSAQKAY